MTSDRDEFLARAYADKKSDYYDGHRPEMVPLVPSSCKRLLEVGCGGGAFASVIKTTLGCEVWGVEPEASAAKLAETRIDRVYNGLFNEAAGLPDDFFDCIVFNDVLEHMLDPGAALTYARRLLTRQGSIVASIPNIGHFPNTWRLAVRGDWEYTERGILDKTHLRFFTRKSIKTLFESAGYGIDVLTGINSYFSMVRADDRLWKYYRLLSLVPTDGIKDMRFLQFAVRATPAK